MSDNYDFFTILTTYGRDVLADALAAQRPLVIQKMAIGDSEGEYYIPTPDQTQLRRELWQGDLNALYSSDNNHGDVIAEMVVPADAPVPGSGGWYIREVGLYDSSGGLIAVGAYPLTYQPDLSSGSGKQIYIRIIVEVDNVAALELIVDPNVVIATKADLEPLLTASYVAKNRKLLGVANDKLRADDKIKIICVGDSMTVGHDNYSDDRVPGPNGNPFPVAPVQYPSRLQERLQFFTNCQVTVINRGYSGDTAKSCYERWTTNPCGDVVHIMLGINDAGGAYGATFPEYCEYMEKLIRRYIDWGHAVVVHTSTAQTFNNVNGGGARFTQYARSVGLAYGCPIFESETVNQNCKFEAVYSDGTHFNKAGYAKYGDAVTAFILAGGWVRPIRPINSYTAQQPGRATEGIGYFGKGVSTGTDTINSYLWDGATGGLGAANAIASFSFYLDSEAANIFVVGDLQGGYVSCSDPVFPVNGENPCNRAVPKFYRTDIVETHGYTVPVRDSAIGKKSWVGSLVGRGWKTVYLRNISGNQLYFNYLIVEPCSPEDVRQTNGPVSPGRKEVAVFKTPLPGRSNPSDLPAPVKMPGIVLFSLPKGLYRQSTDWTSYYDAFTVSVTIKTDESSGGSAYNGITKLICYLKPDASFAVEVVHKTAPSCVVPRAIEVSWQDPDDRTEELHIGWPRMPDAPVYMGMQFSDVPPAYFTIEVECNNSLNAYGAWLD
ncbi:phage tail-collar fiber domain-containing protein [Salmonella enterica subsp. enterica serovar 3,10:z10:-]